VGDEGLWHGARSVERDAIDAAFDGVYRFGGGGGSFEGAGLRAGGADPAPVVPVGTRGLGETVSLSGPAKFSGLLGTGGPGGGTFVRVRSAT